MRNKKERNTDWGGLFGSLWGKGSNANLSQRDVINSCQGLSPEYKRILNSVLDEQEKSETARFKENLKAVKEWNTRSALQKNKANHKSEVNREQSNINKGEIAD